MQNTARSWWLIVPLAALLLTATAWLRGAEYDEQYTLFLTAGTPRPDWPQAMFPAGLVARTQQDHAGLIAIASDLRTTDVHPPVYFWAIFAWRRLLGPTLFTARLFSVLCATVSVLFVGLIARRRGVIPGPAMLVTLACYGFAYTSAVARGFALAEMLSLGAVLLVQKRQWLSAGLLFGAACACNYLAVFVAAAVIAQGAVSSWRTRARNPSLAETASSTLGASSSPARVAWRSRACAFQTAAIPVMLSAIGMAPFLALDAWFFAAQHGARNGQFPPFAPLNAVLRLAAYQGAAVFGGWPMYVDGAARLALGGLIAAVGVVALLHTRPWREPTLLMIAAATPIGLLLLGAIFNNTPIELRYLSFGLPFVALLLTRRGLSPPLLLVLAIQSAGIVGLLVAPTTMQPARAAAQDAAALAPGALVLLPRGNDGVGIVGAFGIEAPPSQPLLLVSPADTLAGLTGRIGPSRRVVLALLAQDRDSAAAIPVMHAAVSRPGWRLIAIGSNVEVYERAGPGG